MRIEELKKAMELRPFRPFFIRMADGREVRVTYPDAVAWGSNEARTVICAQPDGGWDVIEVALVTSLGYPAAAERPAEDNGE
jgi:hypothetical protein